MAEQSKEERYVRAIERARRPRGSEMDFNQGTLSNALNILSTDLNTKPSHYQLELVQNADDNTYAPGVEPSLTFVFQGPLTPHGEAFLWVGCNEIGFDEASVKAICDIGGSTKKAKGPQGYIGEKGIGFKASFKIADKVWIKSGNYHFSLIREGLGMISPVWEEFKRTNMLDEQTMFCLRIPRREDQTHVKAEMLSLKPELLLFLRKLRNINVMVDDRREKVVHQFSVHRKDNADDIEHGYTTTQLSRDDVSPQKSTASNTLVVFRHTTHAMPEEAKRPGMKHTEIVIAFPTAFDGSSRMTYNFLPIRDLGFPFLLHADFITNINREDIIHRNNWNESLITNAADLFVQCIQCFNRARTGQMQSFKYTWPQFVKSTHAASDTVMATFFADLRKRLSKETVLVSRAGDPATPASLNILPLRWANDGGDIPLPLFSEQHHMKSYVSDRYDCDDLASLQVKAQNPAYFAGLLKKMADEKLQQKGAQWHSRLAQALNETPAVIFGKLEDIKIIPLRDGTWVTPAKGDGAIYFQEAQDRLEVPGAIEIRIVDAIAASDESRNKLFKRLMVQKLDQQQVCDLILKRHKELDSAASDLPNLSVDILVDHALYLHRFRDVLNIGRLKFFKFAVSGSSRTAFAHELYMDSMTPNTFRMSLYFGGTEDCDFIHPSYFEHTAQVKKDVMYAWMDNLGISTRPKLVNKSEDGSSLDPLFKRLMDLPNSMIWLTLLRDNWSHDCTLIKLLPKNCIQHTLVTCKDGARKPLNKVYWATTDVLKEPLASSGGVDLLDVSDHNFPWRDLDGPLGLKRKVDLDFFLIILRKVARGQVTARFSDVSRLMQGILNHVKSGDNNNESIIRNAFEAEKLIAIPDGDSLSWVALKDCLWKSPQCLIGFTPLAGVYHQVEDLFTGPLELKNATAHNIAEQLELNTGKLHEIENTKALLLELSSLLPSDDTLDGFPLDLFERIEIFPVRQLNGELALATADDETWFIADNRRQQKLFQGKVALLDFTLLEFPHLMPLLRLLKIARRTLSGSVVDEMVIQGTSKLLPELSSELQTKAKYIALLVPNQDKTAVETKVQTIEVFSSKRMRLKRYIQIGGRKIYGTGEAGKAIILEHETPLQLHCRHSIMSQKRQPWFFICETMAKIFHISGKYRETLAFICITPAGPLIEDILSIHGLWDEAVSDIDDVEEEDEPEESTRDRSEERVNNHQDPTVISEGEDQSDDCLFVSKQPKSTPSFEPKTPTVEEDICDDEEVAGQETPSTTARSTRSTRSKFGFAFNRKGPSLSDVRKASAAQRETSALNAIATAAANYDIDEVKVYAPPVAQGNRNSSLTGFDFGETKHLREFADQNNRTQYLGELFVRGVLNAHFAGASDDAWTSDMRTRQNLGKFEIELLSQSSPFTVIGSDLTANILEWLDARLKREDKDRAGESPDTYHIFVKATAGTVDEHFALSNDEARLVKRWSSCESDAVLIFRIYDLKQDPKFVVLVDPIELMADGQATMNALGGGFSMNICGQ